MAGRFKTRNEYVESMGKFFEATPKVVFAALAYWSAQILTNRGAIAHGYIHDHD